MKALRLVSAICLIAVMAILAGCGGGGNDNASQWDPVIRTRTWENNGSVFVEFGVANPYDGQTRAGYFHLEREEQSGSLPDLLTGIVCLDSGWEVRSREIGINAYREFGNYATVNDRGDSRQVHIDNLLFGDGIRIPRLRQNEEVEITVELCPI